MAITYFTGSTEQGERATILTSASSNIEIGQAANQYKKIDASGLQADIVNLENLEGTYDEAPLVGARNYRVPGLPSGYATTGAPTYGSGRINTNTSLNKDLGLTASGYYNFLSGGRTVNHKTYNGLTS